MWGKPCIMCANYDPRMSSNCDWDWMAGNVDVIHIPETEPLARVIPQPSRQSPEDRNEQY